MSSVPGSPSPTPTNLFYVGVYCDDLTCAQERRGDVLADTRDAAYEVIRKSLRADGWRCDPQADLCPNHRDVNYG